MEYFVQESQKMFIMTYAAFSDGRLLLKYRVSFTSIKILGNIKKSREK